jgi:hypothetical protein
MPFAQAIQIVKAEMNQTNQPTDSDQLHTSLPGWRKDSPHPSPTKRDSGNKSRPGWSKASGQRLDKNKKEQSEKKNKEKSKVAEDIKNNLFIWDNGPSPTENNITSTVEGVSDVDKRGGDWPQMQQRPRIASLDSCAQREGGREGEGHEQMEEDSGSEKGDDHSAECEQGARGEGEEREGQGAAGEESENAVTPGPDPANEQMTKAVENDDRKKPSKVVTDQTNKDCNVITELAALTQAGKVPQGGGGWNVINALVRAKIMGDLEPLLKLLFPEENNAQPTKYLVLCLMMLGFVDKKMSNFENLPDV